MSGFSAPAQVASQIASAIGGLFRRGAISASTGLTDSTLSYAGESYAVPTAIVPYAIGEVPTVDDEVVTLQVNGQPALLGKVVRSGLTPAYSPIPVVSSLPTASATYRGVPLRTAGATGVADGVYVCTKDASDAYSWVRVDNVASAYGILSVVSGTGHSVTSDTVILTSTVTVPGGYIRMTGTVGIKSALSSGGGRVTVTFHAAGSAVATFTVTLQFTSANQFDWYTWSWTVNLSAGSKTFTVNVADASSSTTSVATGSQLVVEAVNAP